MKRLKEKKEMGDAIKRFRKGLLLFLCFILISNLATALKYFMLLNEFYLLPFVECKYTC
jgi:hypothetical protein